ncbi:acyltransferase [Desulfocucumis palustris]|uniref:Acyltransferase n=1 Tax=Desulfocucumis palustris TaxID=1898651 RepID=A0A2L2XKG3_9FIRM|nr:1-acyl-sn-glycerol-3-phosphate acyltransferase [Desulfocucumis palustris]GBF34776.1 acyltransferase [Desulfocucumis palustris]
MIKLISSILLKIMGWQTTGGIPPEIKKCVIVAAPHTSNHDFYIARAACYKMNIKVHYLIKKDWMFFPLGLFFKATGAFGVDRKKSNNMVNDIVELFSKSKELKILISPEGTRKTVRKWKTGFYHTALGADVPIILSYLDYKKKIACIGPVLYPTGDLVKDMQPVFEFYRDITPRHPLNYNLEII